MQIASFGFLGGYLSVCVAAPWRYLPYLFAGLVLTGTLLSGYFRTRTPAPNAL